MYKRIIVFIFGLFPVLIISYHTHAATAYLYWDPPESGGPVDGYMVYWSKISGSYKETDAMNAEQTNETEITWLNDAEEYYFVVKAYNLSGMSPVSNEVVYPYDATDGKGGGGGGCFIATAAYGSAFESHVKILKEFRDSYLMPTMPGRAFVNLYYQYSPVLADVIAKHDVLKIITRWGLAPVVGMTYVALNTGEAEKVAILVGTIMLMMGCWVFLIKRRGLRSGVSISSQ